MGKSFKFSVTAFGSTIVAKKSLDMINSFSFLGFDGDIDMTNPQFQFNILVDFGSERSKFMKVGTFEAEKMYLGKLVTSGSRDLVNRYNLKKRNYLGTTSMDAELSLIMANQALAGPGKLVYDPFVGTGSFLVTCSHFGAYTLGSDIDGRQIRGKGKSSIKSNVAQYDLGDRVLDTLTFDICHNPWRIDNWLDAIVTDRKLMFATVMVCIGQHSNPLTLPLPAPYGVRAGAKKLGRKENSKKQVSLRTYEGLPMHE
jgi:tRNA (guanine10-N2)-methyltransferase